MQWCTHLGSAARSPIRSVVFPETLCLLCMSVVPLRSTNKNWRARVNVPKNGRSATEACSNEMALRAQARVTAKDHGDEQGRYCKALGAGAASSKRKAINCCALLGLRHSFIIAQPAAALALQMLTSAMMQGTKVEPMSHHVRHRDRKLQR